MKLTNYDVWGENKWYFDKVEPLHYLKNTLVRETIKNLCKSKKIKNICEVGCGVGILSNDLADSLHNSNIEAYDLNSTAIKIAKKFKKNDSVEFYNENLSRIGKKKFDLVFAVEVLEHIKNDIHALKKMGSLMKNNGLLILTVPANKAYWTNFDKRSKHFRRYSEKELTKKLISSGFNIVKMKYFGYPLSKFYYFKFYLPASLKLSSNKKRKLPFWFPALRVIDKVFLFDFLFNSNKAIFLMAIASK